MNILAERVTDLLQEGHEAKYKEIKESPEYAKFEQLYDSSELKEMRAAVDSYKSLKSQQAVLEGKMSVIRDGINKRYREENPTTTNHWTTIDPDNYLKVYLDKIKREQYPEVEFNREKTLRRVQADILLSDHGSADELVKSLVEKLKQ